MHCENNQSIWNGKTIIIFVNVFVWTLKGWDIILKGHGIVITYSFSWTEKDDIFPFKIVKYSNSTCHIRNSLQSRS